MILTRPLPALCDISARAHPPSFDNSELTFDPRHARANFTKSRHRQRARAGGRVDPIDGVDFVTWTRFTPRPVRDERGDDIMGSNAFALALDRFDVPVEATISASTPTSSGSSRATANTAHLNICRP
jgi:hypothetical protein